MSNIDIQGIIDDLKVGAIDAARQVASSMLQEAAKDATAFVSMATPAIMRYLDLAIAQKITLDEFKSLMLGLVDLAKMAALTEAGLAEVEIDRTRNALLKTVTSLAIGTVSKLI